MTRWFFLYIGMQPDRFLSSTPPVSYFSNLEHVPRGRLAIIQVTTPVSNPYRCLRRPYIWVPAMLCWLCTKLSHIISSGQASHSWLILCLIYKSVLIFCFNQLCTCNLAYRIASKCSQCTTIQTFPVVWKCKAPMSFWRDRDFSHSLLGLEEQSGTSLPYRYRDLQWLAEFQHSIEAFLQSAHQIRLLHPSGWAIYTSSCSSPFKKHLFVQIATTVLWDSNRTTGENISS